MSKTGGSLMDLVRPLQQAIHPTGFALADSMGKNLQRNIRRNTPVETYHLRESIDVSDISYGPLTLQTGRISVDKYAWTGEVFTLVDYAPHVEYGTGLWGPSHTKYKIEPKTPGGTLAFRPYARDAGGGVVLNVEGRARKSGVVMVRFVLHPGSPGHAMFRIGATLTEAEHDRWSREPLRWFKAHVEGNLAGRLA